MNNEKQKLALVADMIQRDARAQGVDLASPANAFSVWAGGFFDLMKYCGSCTLLDNAWMLAAKHVNLKELYIVKGPLDAFGITRFERENGPSFYKS